MNTGSFLDDVNFNANPTHFSNSTSPLVSGYYLGEPVSDVTGPKSGHGTIGENSAIHHLNPSSMKGTFQMGGKRHSRKHTSIKRKHNSRKRHSRKRTGGKRKHAKKYHSRKYTGGKRKYSKKHHSRKHRGGSTVGYSAGSDTLSPDNSFEANPPPITRYSCQSK